MGFGASLAFLAVGAVLAFAVKWDVPGIDLQMIGWILMGVGGISMFLTTLYSRRAAAARTEEVMEVVEPDTLYTRDPGHDPFEPHAHVREEHVREEETRVIPPADRRGP